MLKTLEELISVIRRRKESSAEESYTKKLLSDKNLSVENPPIQQAIDNGVVPILITFLSTNVSPKFQFEAAWAVTNITSGTSQQVVVVVQAGAIPPLVHLLSSPNDDVREQAVWALGNIAGDSTDHRNKVLQAKAMDPLLVQLNCNTKLSVLRVGTWMLSNLCRGKPQPLFSLVSPSLTTLGKLLLQKDDEILTEHDHKQELPTQTTSTTHKNLLLTGRRR